MDYKTTSQALAICIADSDAVIIWGPPGNGKTTVINDVANKYNLHLETVIASIREPSDFAGIPYHSNGIMHLAPPSWAQRIVEASHNKQASIAFYDEISTAPPSTQAALLRPILEGVVGDLSLPPSTRTIAAANFPDEAADGWDLSAPIANRFTHLDWELNAKTVKQGFVHGWEALEIPSFPKASIMDVLRKRSLALVGIFLGTRPNLVNGKMVDNTKKDTSYQASDFAFPTPRSWETAAKLYAACQAAVLPDRTRVGDDVLALLLMGTVGKGAATEFMSFINKLDLPDTEDLLDRKIEFAIPQRGDQLDAICSGILISYVNNPSTERWYAWGDILSALVDNGKADAAYKYFDIWNKNRPQGIVPTKSQVTSLSKIMTILEKK